MGRLRGPAGRGRVPWSAEQDIPEGASDRCEFEDLDTPTVLCDLDVLDRNLAAMPTRSRELGLPLRPHTKSHKIPELAHRQMAAGAVGICCQKLGDAEAMVAAGLQDILIPYNLVGPLKVERLLRLARRATVTVALDSEDTARGIAEQAGPAGVRVPVLMELDTGARRCGVQSPQAARDLARAVARLEGLDFRGVMTYPTAPGRSRSWTRRATCWRVTVSRRTPSAGEAPARRRSPASWPAPSTAAAPTSGRASPG